MIRGPVAEISLSALRTNIAVIRRAVAGRGIIAVVKADAYGHGSTEIAQALASEGIRQFAVAYTDEGKSLRESGITQEIIVLHDRTDTKDFFDFRLTPVIHDLAFASELSGEAQRRGVQIPVHVKIDTGMGRLGIPREKALAASMEIAGLPGISITGLMSHFSDADSEDLSFARQQLSDFRSFRDAFTRKTGISCESHIANSAALFTLPESHCEAVRPGIALYGYAPNAADLGLEPVMRVSTGILTVRELAAATPVSYGRTFITKRKSRIAVLPLGYADGYPRMLSNRAEVLIQGKRAPLVGRVCMDLIMVDVTDIRDVHEGEEVMLIGRHGSESIGADELAERAGTISYEILTGIGMRARRICSG